MDDDKLNQLIERIRAGGSESQDAWDDFGNEVFSLVCRWAQQWTQNSDDAQDVAQTTLLKVYLKLETYDNTRPLRPWLKKIALNTWRDMVAGRKNVVELGEYLADEQSLRDYGLIEMRLTLELLERHLNEQEQIVLRSLLDSLGDVAAAAAAAGVTPSRVYQIRRALRKKFVAELYGAA